MLSVIMLSVVTQSVMVPPHSAQLFEFIRL
jgi:hypothetical protein